MPADWLLIWGGVQIAGFVFKPILEHLALKAAEGFATDFLKGCIKSVLKPEDQDALTTVVGKALKEFLQIMQEQLEGAGLNEEELLVLVAPVESLLMHRDAQSSLRSPLVSDSPANPSSLATAWNELHLPDLPADFSWSHVATRYTKRAIQIRRESDRLRDLLDSEVLQKISEVLQSSAPVSPDSDLRRYQRAMLQSYGHLKLESLDATTYDFQRIRLDGVFVPQHVREFTEFIQKVFELPKEFQQRVKLLRQIAGETVEDREASRFRKAYFKQSPRSVIELLQDRGNRLLVILGDPGSGKSSLLQFIIIEWAGYTGHDLETLEVPLLIELREYARNRRDGLVKDFLEYLHQGAGVPCRLNQHWVAQRLKDGKASLLFDGLDEVFDPEQRREICADIARFANDYVSARIIVTSRVIGYKAQPLRDSGFRHFMLQDLNDAQIKTFLGKWHALAYPDGSERKEKQERLSQAIADSRPIRELAGNPLLLTMMAILNRTQELPRDRSSLYEQCSRLLLYQWKAEEALRADERFRGITLDFKDKLAMLRRVARTMQNMEHGLAGNLISQDKLEIALEEVLRELDLRTPKLLARAVIEHLRTRNFILCYVGGENYAFVHRTFLEYFCASDFVWQFKEDRTIDLEHLKTKIFGVHWNDEAWAEVLCLIAGMLVPRLAGEIIAFLLTQWANDGKSQNVFLADRCYAEVRNKSEIQAEATELRNTLKAVVATPLPERVRVKKKALAAAGIGSEGVARLLQEAAKKNELAANIRRARTEALTCFATSWPSDAETYLWLQEIAEKHSEATMRDTALRRLADFWGGLSSTFDFFIGLIGPDKSSIVRLAALSHLSRRWQNDVRLLDLSYKLAGEDSDMNVQKWAIVHLATYHLNEPKTQIALLTIVERGLTGEGGPLFVRVECYKGLAQAATLDPIAFTWAKEELARDATLERGAKAKRAAMAVLAKASKDDLDVPRLLLNLGQESPSKKTRKAAARLLNDSWNHLPEVQAFVSKQNDTPSSSATDLKQN